MTDTYRIRSPETWAQARDDYVAGLSAEAVCRRYDLGLSAFRRRARKYGWRRADQNDPEPADLDLSIYGDLTEDDEMETARLRYLHALERGKPMEARRWRELWQELQQASDAWIAMFCPGDHPEEVRSLRAAAPIRGETEAEVRLLSGVEDIPPAPLLHQPESEPAPSDHGSREKVHDVHSIFSGVHFSDDSRPSKRAARRRRGRGHRRQADVTPEFSPRSAGP